MICPARLVSFFGVLAAAALWAPSAAPQELTGAEREAFTALRRAGETVALHRRAVEAHANGTRALFDDVNEVLEAVTAAAADPASSARATDAEPAPPDAAVTDAVAALEAAFADEAATAEVAEPESSAAHCREPEVGSVFNSHRHDVRHRQ